MTTVVVNSLQEQLQDFGLSEYEARTYVALLGHEPVTAYEAAKLSGVPSSKIYQVFARLVEKEAVVILEEGGKSLYAAQPPKEFLARRREDFEENVRGVQESLESMAGMAPVSYIWNIRRYDELMNRLRQILRDAKREVILSAYAPELAVVRPELEALAERGVKLAVVHFGPHAYSVGNQYFHPIEDTLMAEHGGRMMTVVSDSETALTATIVSEREVGGAWSQSRGFVLLAEDYVRHDIYITKIVSRFDEDLTKTYGNRYHLLRDVFQDVTIGRTERSTT